MTFRTALLFGSLLSLACGSAFGQQLVPTEVQMPGTQPLEIGTLESPDKCDNCHGGYNSATEPAHNWRGSMMAHAGRDPIFWATLAVAEQDFAGAGDLCLRCHSTGGWLAGRSTPTDGSGLAAGDGDGVECDYCHKMTNPDNSEHQGEQFSPFIANNGAAPAEGYFGSGMASLWGGADKLGPYNNADARHQFMYSKFHRDRNFCGTCHDVSNPVTGDLAHNRGQMNDPAGIVASGSLGSPVSVKAAFNNLPHAYGIVERTFSEYLSGGISGIAVNDYPGMSGVEGFPAGGALEAVWKAATKSGTVSADYQNPSQTRYFSCQSCHMRPVTGLGANKRGVPVRDDLPLHDMTGGNYWMPSAIAYLDGQGRLRLGGGMSELQLAAMFDGANRAIEQLQLAASLELEVEGGQVAVKIINHTGHKLITGYPEGRRMWLNVKWFDETDALLREDGAYGTKNVTFRGDPEFAVRTLLNPESTTVFEAHMGLTQEWAASLIGLDVPGSLPLMYDPDTGLPAHTLGELAGSQPGSARESFHFALNNTVISDNRIPPWKMSYDTAKARNALPVPATQYGGPGAGGTYDHYAELYLQPPVGAVSAAIRLMYQPTSWEYIQFLALANDGGNAFLADEGNHLLEAWLNTGMAEPMAMAEATWGNPGGGCDVPTPAISAAVAGDKQVTIEWMASGGVDGYRLYYDQAGKSQLVATSGCFSGACSLQDTGLTNGIEYTYKLTAFLGECESDFSTLVSATPQAPGHQQTAGVDVLETGRWVKEGKGKNATTTWETSGSFVQGDTVVIRGRILGTDNQPLSGATFSVNLSGPETAALTSAPSGADGWAEANWTTQSPNRKGNGGTAPGSYDLSVDGVMATGYHWDGIAISISISLQ
jgi:hypothetical protein